MTHKCKCFQNWKKTSFENIMKEAEPVVTKKTEMKIEMKQWYTTFFANIRQSGSQCKNQKWQFLHGMVHENLETFTWDFLQKNEACIYGGKLVWKSR